MLVDYRKRAERRQDFYEKIVSEFSTMNVKIYPNASIEVFMSLIEMSVDFFFGFIVESRSNAIYADSWPSM